MFVPSLAWQNDHCWILQYKRWGERQFCYLRCAPTNLRGRPETEPRVVHAARKQAFVEIFPPFVPGLSWQMFGGFQSTKWRGKVLFSDLSAISALALNSKLALNPMFDWPEQRTTSPKAILLSTWLRPDLVETVRFMPEPAGCGSMATAQLPFAAAVAFHGPPAAATAASEPPPDRVTVTSSPGAAASPQTAAFAGPRCSTMFESKKWGSSFGPARKRPFFEFFLRLSRACIGKSITFSVQIWLKGAFFAHLWCRGHRQCR